MNIELRNKLWDRFQKDLNAPIHVCDLGSCQYASVQAAYEFALAYLALDRAEFEELMGISYTRQLTREEFIQALEKDINDNMDEEEIEDYGICKLTSIEDYFDWGRDKAWDLWSAGAVPFENFQMEPPENTNFQRTGFLLNDIITQTESIPTGIYLAYITWLFNEPMSTFAEFST